jgi:hypothetical protein
MGCNYNLSCFISNRRVRKTNPKCSSSGSTPYSQFNQAEEYSDSSKLPLPPPPAFSEDNHCNNNRSVEFVGLDPTTDQFDLTTNEFALPEDILVDIGSEEKSQSDSVVDKGIDIESQDVTKEELEPIGSGIEEFCEEEEDLDSSANPDPRNITLNLSQGGFCTNLNLNSLATNGLEISSFTRLKSIGSDPSFEPTDLPEDPALNESDKQFEFDEKTCIIVHPILRFDNQRHTREFIFPVHAGKMVYAVLLYNSTFPFICYHFLDYLDINI